MKSLLKSISAVVLACAFTVAAFAADASLTGTWKWSQAGRGGQSSERKVKLEVSGDKVTGAMLASEGGPMGPTPEIAISDGSFKDGVVTFSVVREFQGNKFTVKYSGKLDGDSIKGSSEFPGMNGGEPMKRDWMATRVK